MKKKIALLLSTVLMVLVLGSCGTDPTTFEHKGVTYDDLYKSSNDTVQVFSSLSKEQLQEIISEADEQGSEETSIALEACEKWLSAMDEAGEYEGIVEDSFTLTKSGKTVTTTLTLEFTEREVTFELVYNYFDMELTGITIEPVYSLGEKMVKAALNTVICRSIVFLVLIIISLIIYCFKFFSYFEQKKAGKAKIKMKKEEPPVDTNPVVTETPQLADDTELVAVIAAAIAASTGTSTSDFVVRSIRRR